MSEKIKIGISSCLLGKRVRYDGGHKIDHYLAETLGRFVEWVPVCPEVESGLGIPREAMRLAGDPAPRLVTRKTGVDHTPWMKKWARVRLRELDSEELCGFVFKSRSPSCGMRGIFARDLIDAFPLMPVDSDDRLRDPSLRENFIERVFVFSRWRDLTRRRSTIGELVTFHCDHELVIMAHSPAHVRQLGRLVTDANKLKTAELYKQYLPLMIEGLKMKATVKKNVKVLDHLIGYFGMRLTDCEKQELQAAIGEYRLEHTPLIVPLTLLKHFVSKYDEPYLKRQYYLNPHPADMMLRYHV